MGMPNGDRGHGAGAGTAFRIPRLVSVFVFALALALPPPAPAGIPWKLPAYTLVARDMDLRTALDTFAVAEGLSVVMSPSVSGVFSGDFKDTPPLEFLDKLATTHNLIWYYDGAALYVYGAGEIATMLIDLQYMKAGEVRQMLAELGVEDARYPLKTASGDQLVMVSGPPRYVALVAEMVSKADALREKKTFLEVEARIFPLVYTWADDVSFSVSSPESTATIKGVATLLTEIMEGGFTLSDAGLSPEDRAKAEAVRNSGLKPMIKAENRLNAVIVRDTSSRMPMYAEIISKLDVPQKLVEIDVTTVELSQKNALDWQLSVSGTGTRRSNSVGVGMNAGNGFGTEDIAGNGLAGALTHLGRHYNLGVSLTALREKGKARSISRTQLLTVNNLAVEMTDSQSYHAKMVGTEVATLQEVSAGTSLNVKPRILPTLSTNMPNQIWLSLQLNDGGFEAISVDSMPMKRTSSLTTQTAVFEDESIMLAGYLRDIEEDAGWGIPYLRDLPLIGWIFGGRSTRKETVQRVFIVTPHVVDLDQEMLYRLQATRLRDISVGEEVERDLEESEEEEEEESPLDELLEPQDGPDGLDGLDGLDVPAAEVPDVPEAEEPDVPAADEPDVPAVEEPDVPAAEGPDVPEAEGPGGSEAPVPVLVEEPVIPDVPPVLEPTVKEEGAAT